MKPSIGRIVIFHVKEMEGDINNGALEAPAMILRVWNDTCVNLRVFFDGDGCLTEFKSSATNGSEPGQWSWPERV